MEKPLEFGNLAARVPGSGMGWFPVSSRGVVRIVEQTVLDSTRLDFRAGLDHTVYHDGDLRLDSVEKSIFPDRKNIPDSLRIPTAP